MCQSNISAFSAALCPFSYTRFPVFLLIFRYRPSFLFLLDIPFRNLFFVYSRFSSVHWEPGLLSQYKDQPGQRTYPIVQEAEWAWGPVWSATENLANRGLNTEPTLLYDNILYCTVLY